MKYFVKIPLIILFFFCIFNIQNVFAADTALLVSSSKTEIEEGKNFTVDIKIDSPVQNINAVSGVINFPKNLLSVVSISKDASVVNLWIVEPKIDSNGQISFEGVILNPGFTGKKGLIFRVNFKTKSVGFASVAFSEGSALLNDGLGSNTLVSLGSTSIKIVPRRITTGPTEEPTKIEGEKEEESGSEPTASSPKNTVALPVITEYSTLIESKDSIFIKGKGQPNALTKIIFENVSIKSIGEKFIEFLQTEKLKLNEVLVKNNEEGIFEYVSSTNLVAGVYNATPFLVDEDSNTEKPGFGIQLFVTDSKIVKMLVVVINVLALLIPVVSLCVIIYFIPWYSWRRMRVLKKKLGLEEEKIEVTVDHLKRGDQI